MTPLDAYLCTIGVNEPLTIRGSEEAGASFSACERYRYTLWREWDNKLPRAAWIMLNPSTADETKLDPTVTRVKGFTEAWGYGAFVVTNLFAWRATDPKDMKAAAEPVGASNDALIASAALDALASGGVVICAWSQHGKYRARGQAVRTMLFNRDLKMHYLKMGANGQPHHPLYLPGDLKPIEWV